MTVQNMTALARSSHRGTMATFAEYNRGKRSLPVPAIVVPTNELVKPHEKESRCVLGNL